MFVSIAQEIRTNTDWLAITTKHKEKDTYADERIIISFGVLNNITLSIDEAKRLFLELEIALREAYEAEGAA